MIIMVPKQEIAPRDGWDGIQKAEGFQNDGGFIITVTVIFIVVSRAGNEKYYDIMQTITILVSLALTTVVLT